MVTISDKKSQQDTINNIKSPRIYTPNELKKLKKEPYSREDFIDEIGSNLELRAKYFEKGETSQFPINPGVFFYNFLEFNNWINKKMYSAMTNIAGNAL